MRRNTKSMTINATSGSPLATCGISEALQFIGGRQMPTTRIDILCFVKREKTTCAFGISCKCTGRLHYSLSNAPTPIRSSVVTRNNPKIRTANKNKIVLIVVLVLC